MSCRGGMDTPEDGSRCAAKLSLLSGCGVVTGALEDPFLLVGFSILVGQPTPPRHVHVPTERRVFHSPALLRGSHCFVSP